MQIPLATYAYRRAGQLNPAIELTDVLYEQSPTNLKDGSALMTRPTLTEFATVGAGPFRAVLWEADVFGDDIVVVSGDRLYRVHANGTNTNVGAVPINFPGLTSDGDLVDLAASPDKVLIANNDLLISNGASVTTVVFPDDQAVVSVAYIDGYFLAVPANSHRIYYTNLVTGLFDADRFISAERYPDDILRLVVTSDEVWAMGTSSVEVFARTGVDTDTQPPFQRVEGRLYTKGTFNGWTVTKVDNTVFWVGPAEDGGAGVFRGDAVPVKISTPAIDERITKADPLTLKAWVFGYNGHSLYVLSMGDQGTAVYDISTQRWTDFTSYLREKWRAHLGVGRKGVVYAGDDETGQLWLLEDGTTDDGDPVGQVFTAGAPVQGRVPNYSVALDCAVGQGNKPLIRLEHSDDQGRTWVDDGTKSFGEIGDYDKRVRWTRLGMMKSPARVYRWTVTDPVRLRISAAMINETF